MACGRSRVDEAEQRGAARAARRLYMTFTLDPSPPPRPTCVPFTACLGPVRPALHFSAGEDGMDRREALAGGHGSGRQQGQGA